MSQERRMVAFGNWKSNGGKEFADEVIQFMNRAHLDPRTEVIISPPSLYVDYVRTRLDKRIAMAIQNKPEKNDSYPQMHPHLFCCYSPAMVKDIGCDWAILGPNDVRENNSEGLAKVLICQQAGIGVVPVIGESLEEKEAGKTLDACYQQLQVLVNNVQDWSSVVIAYEPLWAIAGKRLMPEDVQEILSAIRQWIHDNVSPDVASSIRLLYGGSVTAANCRDYAAEPDFDGFLIGKAALNPEFIQIINARYSGESDIQTTDTEYPKEGNVERIKALFIEGSRTH